LRHRRSTGFESPQSKPTVAAFEARWIGGGTGDLTTEPIVAPTSEIARIRWKAELSLPRKDVRRLKRVSCPPPRRHRFRFLVRLERRFLVPA
jgi:hypothetical protein